MKLDETRLILMKQDETRWNQRKLDLDETRLKQDGTRWNQMKLD